MAPHREEVNHFDVRSRDQDCKTTTNSRVNTTSAANARMSAANRGSAKMSFWNGITQRLQSLSLDIAKIGATPARPFATNSHCHSQAEPGKPQEALFEAEAGAEAASLERQLENLRIPTVALNDVDDNSAGFAEKIAKLRPQLRALKSNSSKSEDAEAQAPSGGRVRLRVVRSQKRHAPMERYRVRYVVTRSLVAAEEKPQAKPGVEDQEPHGGQKYFRQVTSQLLIRRHVGFRRHVGLGPLGRNVKDGQRLHPPNDMLFHKVNVESAENNASEPQLEIREYHKSEAGKGTKTSRRPRKNAIDRSSPIRFISDTETEDAHIEGTNKLGSELSAKSIELDIEPIEIRRHLSSGQAPKLPSTVKRIQRVPSTLRRIRHVPGFYVSKHAAAEKLVTNPEGNLLIRKHGVGRRSEERPSDVPHSTSAPEIQEIKPNSPKGQARELHSRYRFTSLHDSSPKKTENPREQNFTFRKHKSDAKSPIFVKASS